MSTDELGDQHIPPIGELIEFDLGFASFVEGVLVASIYGTYLNRRWGVTENNPDQPNMDISLERNVRNTILFIKHGSFSEVRKWRDDCLSPLLQSELFFTASHIVSSQPRLL